MQLLRVGAVAGRVLLACGLLGASAVVAIAPSSVPAGAQPAPLAWQPENIPGPVVQWGYWDAEQLDQYAQAQLPFMGGTAPYSATLVSGYLPTGLTLEPDAVVAGDALVPQDTVFTVQVSDSSTSPQTPTGEIRLITGDTNQSQSEIQTDNELLGVPGANQLGQDFVELNEIEQQTPGLPQIPAVDEVLGLINSVLGVVEPLAMQLGDQVYCGYVYPVVLQLDGGEGVPCGIP
jgi:hypothetical protein